ncbi:MAG: glycosyltransferase [Algoriphagus sp.]|uniref:glycosyltransferase n=1 Tax=Algoriphagus sp. TaxID=1872435 RepID=UPI00260E3962|nr:glycosyltransferase [Algoriphagus sp.]MDG1278180.1 glycosyltransferase [Algoriphagus sp.]
MDGILIQRFTEDMEIVVADDYSKDGTLERIKERLKFVDIPVYYLDSEKNLGLGKNYLRGISACKGEYVAILEGDDYWTDPERLRKHVNFLDHQDQCPMSFNPFKIYHEEEKELVSTFSSKEKKMNYYGPKTLIHYNLIGNLSACVFRSSMLNNIPKEWFEYNITDWFLGIALAEIGPVAQFSEEMSVYRVSAKGLWSRHSKQIKATEKENLSYTYDRMLGYRFTREFFGYRLTSKVKNKRDLWIEKVPGIPNRLIIRLFSQGVIFRLSNLIAQVVPLKMIKRDVELYKAF